jgi:hypothetical protein
MNIDLLPLKDPTCARYIKKVQKRRRNDVVISVIGLLIIAAIAVWFGAECVSQLFG